MKHLKPWYRDSSFWVACSVAGLMILAAIGANHFLSPSYESDHWESIAYDTERPQGFKPASVTGLPDAHLTPGAVWKQVTLKDIKESGYSARVRDVTEAMKKEVFARYNVDWGKHADYEVDHLVPLCIGGSNAIENLWPQPYDSHWGARVKDRLEVEALKMIREEKLDMAKAQHEIATDWIAMYQRLLGARPMEAHTRAEEQ